MGDVGNEVRREAGDASTHAHFIIEIYQWTYACLGECIWYLRNEVRRELAYSERHAHLIPETSIALTLIGELRK